MTNNPTDVWFSDVRYIRADLALMNDTQISEGTTYQKPEPITDFRHDLIKAINRHSMENGSDTPDYILGIFLLDCLMAFDTAVRNRTGWYSQNFQPGWQHEKRGTLYQIIDKAKLQTASPIDDNTTMVVYRDKYGKVFVRPETEFYDGRFIPWPFNGGKDE